LHVLILDHGEGIPNTLKHSKFKDVLERFENRFTHPHKKLWLAFELGAAKSKMAGRGHGLRDIMRFSTSQEQSSLEAWSDKGCYTVAHQRGTKGRGLSRPLEYSFQGTLLEWRIKL
jgi:hypothetical protein